jgi:regulator of Ty1 transposition protein 109
MDTKLSSLSEELAAALPEGCIFTLHHISTPPTKCEPIYSPPPEAKPERTYRESHFLNVSITPDRAADAAEVVAIMAIECLIYTTKHLTTIFVSKADSTGYLPLLHHLPALAPSPLRTIASTFVAFLVKHRVRAGIKLVVDLFARASNQYLYPGSVENPAKHVSDDRQLVRWWTRVLHPIVTSYAAGPAKAPTASSTTARAYLLVPGEDSLQAFLPPAVRLDAAQRARWTHGHPLVELARRPDVPPRCLVPRFPDDPKRRFLVELDDELPEQAAPAGGGTGGMNATDGDAGSGGGGGGGGGGGAASGGGEGSGGGGAGDGAVGGETTHAPPAENSGGKWRSVHSLAQFWELMAFRAECSAGRCVGFMWIVVEMPEEGELFVDEDADYADEADEAGAKQLARIAEADAAHWKATASNGQRPSKRRKKPTGPIVTRLPRIKSTTQILKSKFPEKTQYFVWPVGTRGSLVLEDKDYGKAVEILLDLDFADRLIATQSTKTWIDQVKVLGGLHGDWGDRIVGMKPVEPPPALFTNVALSSTTIVNVLGVKRKNAASETARSVNDEDAKRQKVEPNEQAISVNVLGAGLVRKKPKKISPTQVSTT